MDEAPSKLYKRCDGCGCVFRALVEQTVCGFMVGPYAPVSIAGRPCQGRLTVDNGCHSVIFHGPGHQSTTRCARNHALDPVLVNARAPEPMHCAIVVDTQMFWHGMEAFTGFFDEAPDHES